MNDDRDVRIIPGARKVPSRNFVCDRRPIRLILKNWMTQKIRRKFGKGK